MGIICDIEGGIKQIINKKVLYNEGNLENITEPVPEPNILPLRR